MVSWPQYTLKVLLTWELARAMCKHTLLVPRAGRGGCHEARWPGTPDRGPHTISHQPMVLPSSPAFQPQPTPPGSSSPGFCSSFLLQKQLPMLKPALLQEALHDPKVSPNNPPLGSHRLTALPHHRVETPQAQVMSVHSGSGSRTMLSTCHMLVNSC